MKLTDRERQTLKNFISNVEYYCSYFSKPLPDEDFISQHWKAGLPLDEIVDKFGKERPVKPSLFRVSR
jgi:hypothetical protein